LSSGVARASIHTVDPAPTGTPFSAASPGEVDQWSLEVFDLLSQWPTAQEGQWTKWPPGYLVLEISMNDGRPIEPVILYTADEELTVTFGYWEDHLLSDHAADARQAVDEAKELVRQWLCGEIRTAVFTDASGKWCGSRLVEGEDILPQLGPDWVRSFNPTHVELRSPNRSEWRRFSINGDDVTELTPG
jgi:hypothetical protein